MRSEPETVGLALVGGEAFAPDLVVIGAMRAGTTSLHNWLSQYSAVSLPKMKETDFFIEGKNWSRGFGWYRGLFDTSKLTAEISPNYSKRDVFRGVPERVARANSDTRLVYIVRDPVDRAVSQYQHSWLANGMPDPEDLPGTHDEDHILASSRYAYQMEAWLEQFPQESLLLVDFAELVSSPQEVLQAVARHAGFEPPERLPENSILNSSAELRRMPPWWQGLRESRIGTQLRSIAPGELVRAARNAVGAPTRMAPPPISDKLRQHFAAKLAQDAKYLRKLTGRQFANWSL